VASRRGAPWRWLTPGERAVVVARFRAGARVREVMAEFGLAQTSARRIRDEGALMRPAGGSLAAPALV
jgi:hypothetical protein